MLSKYTLADIDLIFSVHPIVANLPYARRISVYNQAQDRIMNLFDDEVLQITNYSITDNKIVISGAKERNTLPGLDEEDKANLKLGTNNLGQLIYLINELEDFSVPQRRIILNATQDILARLKNDYDILGYYQLWYNALAAAYKLEDESRFRTSFNFITNDLDDFTTTTKNTYNDKIVLVDVSGFRTLDGAFSFKTNFIGKISHIASWLVNESRFRTSFIGTIGFPAGTTFDGEGRFKTSFIGTIYAPATHTNITEVRFRTSFIGTIT